MTNPDDSFRSNAAALIGGMGRASGFPTIAQRAALDIADKTIKVTALHLMMNRQRTKTDNQHYHHGHADGYNFARQQIVPEATLKDGKLIISVLTDNTRESIKSGLSSRMTSVELELEGKRAQEAISDYTQTVIGILSAMDVSYTVQNKTDIIVPVDSLLQGYAKHFSKEQLAVGAQTSRLAASGGLRSPSPVGI